MKASGGPDERRTYELWDGETANCVGAYETLEEALEDVAETIRLYGADSPAVTSLVLVDLDAPPGPRNGLTGPALLPEALARWRPAERPHVSIAE